MQTVAKFLLLYLFVKISCESPDPIVSTEYGKIEGLIYTSSKGFRTEVFLGIPFAQPPINELRFEKPIPPTPWKTPLKAKTIGSPCSTYTASSMFGPTSEDCLTLNILKPETPSNDPNGYPVMVSIHGGAFIFGSAEFFPYTKAIETLVSQGIIVVTINYRLGPFGFFTTGDSNAPGNYGLWDQVEALKFIQKVIHDFNGNPKEVTIFGVSAGGASCSWLSLSPTTKDLFNRAIIMSGSASAPWASAEDDLVESSSKLIAAANCSQNSNIKECLKGKSTAEIQAATSSFIDHGLRGDSINFGYFYPRFDMDFVKASNMKEAIKKAPKKANLQGVCSQEHNTFAIAGSFGNPAGKLVPVSTAKASNFTREDFVEIVHELVATKKAFGSSAQEAAEKIVEFYETQKNLYAKNFYLQLYSQLFSDLTFNIPQMREALQKAKAGSDVYFYVYDYLPEMLKNELLEGTAHGYEFINFNGGYPGFPEVDWKNSAVAGVQKTFIDMFVNFVKNGVPSGETFSAVKVTSKLSYVKINTNSEMKDNLWPERLQFWDSMAKTYGFDLPVFQKLSPRDEL
uniref:Carboxylesterase type B domain-containing protein n=1 Tax=Panagrolaimus davidi TaxID=227884 RepID=A0A914R0N2_9BILA